jgi:hypothetical protein
LSPHPIDQSAVFESQFNGMTDSSFNYEEYQAIRDELIIKVNESLTQEDKEFLLAFSKGDPDWSKVDYSKLPAVKWKLLNINKLKIIDPQKYSEQVAALKQILSMP